MSGIDIHARHKMSCFERTGVDGSIKVDGQQIHIVAELGFLLSMFKDRFESEIRRYLKEHFNCTFSN